MPLFQRSVLAKHLKLQDQAQVEKAYKKYVKYFLNPTIQKNIRESKEEQFQATFLNELFVNVLEYTLNPQPNFNLTTELKNEKNAKKADGAILKDGAAIAVIELKGTNTKDLEKVRQQAFDYKANQSACVYVITSNFEKLRFYINNAVDFEEFDLFNLSQSQFALFHLCLAKENLLHHVPLRIKEASTDEEKKITNDFYSDYSQFKRELFRDLVKLNMKNEAFRAELSLEDTERGQKNIKHKLFKKSQKLIDRFLFIFFAEDRDLLPYNSTKKLLEDWDRLKEMDAIMPLYDRFKLYFNYLDTGRKGAEGKAEIFAYNGGLFKPDATLNSLLISDDLLYKHTKALSKYDFESQIDVNILGHIFENSLNEIESVNAEIEGTNFDKQTTKRKKDGVFYTPKYITKYIVDNTVGKLCEEKKAELNIIDEDYTASQRKDVKRRLLEALETYRAWLLQLTICDPACGSGAFLNQALDFLIHEHEKLDELQTSLLGGGFVFPEIENTVLENNIFGVDLNEESVEIAKLSLWLRTAQPRRKLNDLNKNIQCGNSLIESKAVAGDKAFKWEEAFPHVFEKGGFDVVIGNPPYVRQELFTEAKPYLESKFKTYHGMADLFTYFIELSVEILLNEHGIYSIIVANKWMRASYGRPLRVWMQGKGIIEIIDFGDLPVFADATAYPCILTMSKLKNSNTFQSTIPENLLFSDLQIYKNEKQFTVDMASLNDDGWSLTSKDVAILLLKLKQKGVPLTDYIDGLNFRGVLTGCNEAFVIDEEKREELIREHPSSAELIKPFISGRDVKALQIEKHSEYLIFVKRNIVIENYPAVYNHLIKYKDRLSPKPNNHKGEWSGRKAGKYKWYEIQDTVAYSNYFEQAKIIYPEISAKPAFALDTKMVYPNKTAFIIPIPDKFLLGVLNSSVVYFLFRNMLPKLRGDYYSPSWIYFKTFPILNAEEEEKSVIENVVTQQIILSEEATSKVDKFTSYLQSSFSIDKLTTKLQTWHELTFADFIKELNKAIKTAGGTALTKLQEMEWMDVFETKKAEAQQLKAEIEKTDAEIDRMVYALYGLTEEEIAIVEGA